MILFYFALRVITTLHKTIPIHAAQPQIYHAEVELIDKQTDNSFPVNHVICL